MYKRQPPCRSLLVDQEASGRWEALGGAQLEPALQSGAIALLDAHWLIGLVERGEILLPRQALPDDAFVTLAELRNSTRRRKGDMACLPIVAISQSWAQNDHPDPHGRMIRVVVRALRLLTAQRGRHGIFLDFCSLHQYCRGADGEPRKANVWPRDDLLGSLSPRWPRPQEDSHQDRVIGMYESEERLLRQAVGHLGLLFSHPATHVFMLPSTRRPRLSGYDDDITDEESDGEVSECSLTEASSALPEAAFVIFQESVSTLAKGPPKTVDLTRWGRDHSVQRWSDVRQKCALRRRAPLLPAAFEERLRDASGACPEEARLLGRVYREIFRTTFCDIIEMSYRQEGWGDAEGAVVGKLLGAGCAPVLECLRLSENQISDAGACALAAGLAGTPKLRKLNLFSNRIGDKGAHALATALTGLPELSMLHLGCNAISDKGARSLANPVKQLNALTTLLLFDNSVGTEAEDAVRRAWGERVGNLILSTKTEV